LQLQKGINSPTDVYYLAPAGSEGTKSKNDTIVLAHYIEGGKWDKSDVTGKTRKDIKKYSYKPRKPRTDVLELQKLMNKWLASKLNPSPYGFRGMGKSKRSEVNEDGYWGPLSQEGLNHIRNIDKNVPKEGSGIPKILDYFRSIENQMVPLAAGEKPIAKPLASPTTIERDNMSAANPKAAEARNVLDQIWAKSGVDPEDPFRAAVKMGNKWVLQGLQPSQSLDVPQQYWANLDALFAEMQKQVPTTTTGTPEPKSGGKGADIGTPDNPLQESKSLRGMILKEILAALK